MAGRDIHVSEHLRKSIVVENTNSINSIAGKQGFYRDLGNISKNMWKKTMLSGKRRNAMEIAVSVLENARPGINKTRLVYRTNLNFMLIQRYINFLSEKELIEVVSGPHPLYRTTQRGVEFLDKFSKIKEILGADELSMDQVIG